MDSPLYPSPTHRSCKSQNVQSPARTAQPPWNTARCNRLLRPISSKIACLRKAYQHELRCGKENSGLAQASNVESKRIERLDPSNIKALPCEHTVAQSSKIVKVADQEWIPSPVARKRIKRTYHSKGGRHAAKQSRRESEGNEPPLRDEAIIQMPDARDCSVHYETQAFPCVTGSVAGGKNAPSAPGMSERCPKSWHSVHGPAQVSFSQHAKFVKPSHWKLINGLYNGLDTLLRATKDGKTGPESGARTLFSTCLRKIPQHITEEQLLSTAEDPETDKDVASAVYSDLEALACSPTSGWKPLRVVVRAHGVSILGNAFREGLLSPSIGHGLITICLHYRAFDEAQHLVECIISSMKPLRRSQLTDQRLFARECSVELSTLQYFVTASGRFRFLYQQLATILDRGLLPLEWISTPGMVGCWNGVIRSITQEDEHSRAATILLQTVISMTYNERNSILNDRIHQTRLQVHGISNVYDPNSPQSIKSIPSQSLLSSQPQALAPGKALSGVISDVLTVLCAVSLLRRSTSPASNPSRTLNLIVVQDIGLRAHQILTIRQLDADPSPNAITCMEHLYLPFLAAVLAEDVVAQSEATAFSRGSSPLDAMAQLDCSKTVASSAASFVCAVAHCCQRATSTDLFDYMQGIIQPLADISTSPNVEKATRILCGRIAVAAAFEYSEETNHPKHLDWALDLEQTTTGTTVDTTYRTPNKTPARRPLTSKSGYRWEEGICEWVAKTPATFWSKPKTIYCASALLSDNEPDGNCPPPTVCQSKQSLLSLLHTSPCSSGKVPGTGRVSGSGRGHVSDGSYFKSPQAIGSSSQVDQLTKPFNETCMVYKDRNPLMTADDETEDELSTPNASQEPSQTSRPQLREVTNGRASMARKRAAACKQSIMTCKRRALCLDMKSKVQWSTAGPLEVDESEDDESEDELSSLAR